VLPLLALFGFPFAPPASDLDFFPDLQEAQSQIHLCGKHIDRLRVLGHIRGWEDGVWEAAITETQFRLTYWQRLAAAHQAGTRPEIKRAVAKLRDHVGPQRYHQHWRPAPVIEMRPLWPCPVAPVRREPGGANGR
jgi:hypothetical protein